jgi:hypothetical protein
MMLPVTAEAAFAARVDGWVRDALARGSQPFSAVLRALPGVYPTEALVSLRRLVGQGGFPRGRLAEIERELSGTDRAEGAGPTDWLPLPHPLDFEWRFSADTSSTLLAHACDLAGRDAPVALIGTPGLCAHLIDMAAKDANFVFVGEDNLVTETLRWRASLRVPGLNFVGCEAMAGLAGTAGAVVVDPP